MSDSMRHRNKRRDDAIRKKVEQELSRKTTNKGMGGAGARGNHGMPAGGNGATGHRSVSATHARQPPQAAGTVSSLRPAAAITVIETARITQAAQLMAAKRADAVLAVNAEGQLAGILTDKDIAYRVVAEALDPRTCTVASVMTRDPIAVYDRGSRNEALSIMVARRFRHLPVISDMGGGGDDDDDGGRGGGDDADDDGADGLADAAPGAVSGRSGGTNVVGLLDITKCIFERMDDLERKVQEDDGIVAAMEALERRGAVGAEQVGAMRALHGCPDVGAILTAKAPEVSVRHSVRDAARMMRDHHMTAVLVLNRDSGSAHVSASASLSGAGGDGDGDGDDVDRLDGIFTTKDIVLRVVAAGLDPATTSVIRVMTPHPDAVAPSTSILAALKKLHAGHYLHLPVVEHGPLSINPTGYGRGRNTVVCHAPVPVGLLDVLTLTMAMLNYLMVKDTAVAAVQAFDHDDSGSGHHASASNARQVLAALGANPLQNLQNLQSPQGPQGPGMMSAEAAGPMWNQFWNATFQPPGSVHMTDDAASSHHSDIGFSPTRSIASAVPAHLQQQHLQQHPQASASAVGYASGIPLPASVRSGPAGPGSVALSGALDSASFSYKLRLARPFTGPGEPERVLRFTAPAASLSALHNAVRTALAAIVVPSAAAAVTAADVWHPAALPLRYLDDDGDEVALLTEADVASAVGVARRAGWSRLILLLGEAAAADAASSVASGHVSHASFAGAAKARHAPSAVPAPVPAPVPVPVPAAVALPTPVAAAAPLAVPPKNDPVTEYLRNAPMPVNLALSAGVVVITAWALRRIFTS